MDQEQVNEVIKVLEKGGAIVYPTDTAYGLGVDATNEKAVQWMYKLKGRGKKKPTHILVSDLLMAGEYVEIPSKYKFGMRKLLPGPITFVLPLRKDAPKAIKILSAGTGSLGIRVSDSSKSKKIVEALGRPITTPSANPADEKTPYSIEEVKEQYKKRELKPNLYINSGELPQVPPSTMVKLNGGVKVLRKGPVRESRIREIFN